MQNSQPSPGFPRKARIAPRRTRRGALMPAAVLAVLVITIVMSQFAQAQLRHASAARAEARAVQLAAIAADFDYYVHENRDALATGLTEANKNRKIDARERADFEDNFLRGGVEPRIPGFDLEYQISRVQDGTEVFGALRLSALDGRSRAQICAVIARLARHGARPAVPAAPQSASPEPTKPRPARTCDASISERVILTAPLSGINPEYVLRMRRAGHPPPKLAGGGTLDLGGCGRDEEPRKCDLLNVKTLTATGGNALAVKRKRDDEKKPNLQDPTLSAQLMSGTLTSVSSVPVKEGTPASDAVVGGNIDVAGTTSADKFIVGSTLIAGELGNKPPNGDAVQIPFDLIVEGPMLLSKRLQTVTLTTPGLKADKIITQRLNIRARAETPTQVGTEVTARQIITEIAKYKDCTGC